MWKAPLHSFFHFRTGGVNQFSQMCQYGLGEIFRLGNICINRDLAFPYLASLNNFTRCLRQSPPAIEIAG
jgi:hypothetical protein